MGHSQPHTSEAWTVPALGLAITLLDQQGRVVEGNVHSKVINTRAKHWADAMTNKPVQGAFLHDMHTDCKVTHSALDSSCDPSVRKMGNFLHKACYRALPLKHTCHCLYWRKANDRSSIAQSLLASTCADQE